MFLNPEENNNIALDRYEAMLKSNRVVFFDSTDFEKIIHHYLDNGQIIKAKKAVSMGLSQHPTSINLKLFDVEILVFEDELDKAEKILNKLQNLEPENEEIYIQRASISSKQNEHNKAIDLLKFALNFSHEPADIHSLLGMEYLFIDDFENAKKHFTECLFLDPDDYSSLYNTINCFNFLEQTEEAIEFLSKYLDVNPYCEIAWHQLGKQYKSQKELKKALAAFDFAIISDDRFVGAYIEKGKILERLQRYEDAIENYIITLGLEDPTSYALLHIGKCFEKLDNKEKALYYYEKTVHEDPLLDKGWIAITKFYISQKNHIKALYYINKAIDIDTENVEYWKHFAQLNFRLKNYEEAEIGYRKTLELGDCNLDVWLNRSDVLLLLEEPDAAIVTLEQALEMYPDSSEITYRLAGIFYNKKEDTTAEKHLKKALTEEPEFFLIIEELFPKVARLQKVKQLQSTFKK